MLGSPLRILPESILGEDMDLEWDEIEDLELDKDNPWLQKYIEFTKVLVESSAGRYPVSHGTLVGPSDLAGVLRGRNRNIFDMYDEPEKTSELLWKTARIFRDVLEEQRKHMPTFLGGYFDASISCGAPDRPSGCRKTHRDCSLRNSIAVFSNQSIGGWPASIPTTSSISTPPPCISSTASWRSRSCAASRSTTTSPGRPLRRWCPTCKLSREQSGPC